MPCNYLNKTLSRYPKFNSYTSLGDKTNTVPNPHLKYYNTNTGKDEYHPAYQLTNADDLERVGRFTSSQNGS